MSEAITPYLPLIGIAIGVLAKGVFDYFQAKRTGTDAKVPTIGEIWVRMEKLETGLSNERSARLTLLDVFRSYVHRVQTGGTSDLTPEERHALDQTAANNQEDTP